MIIGLLLLGGIGISLFVSYHLIRQRGLKLHSHRIALGIQLLWIIRFGLFYGKGDFVPLDNPYLVIYDQTLFFLDGLLVWLYVRALLQPEKSIRKVLWHFIPFILVFTYSTLIAINYPEYVLQVYNQSLVQFQSNSVSLSIGDLAYVVFMLGINLYYLFRSVSITQRYNSELKQNLSSVDNLTVNWVQKYQRLWIILFMIPVALYFINYLFPIMGRISLGYIIVGAFIILSFVFNSYLLEQVYKPVSIFDVMIEEDKPVDSSKIESDLKRLEKLLIEEAYYLNDELSLTELAGYMDMKPAELTQLIKSSSFENFYDLVNSYRIEAVKKQLKESKDQIIQLAYQNGFRSKSTFNKIFKEKTGMTPKEYRLH